MWLFTAAEAVMTSSERFHTARRALLLTSGSQDLLLIKFHIRHAGIRLLNPAGRLKLI